MIPDQKKQDSSRLLLGLGIFLGAIFGSFIKSPLFGMILGGYLGWKLGGKVKTMKTNKKPIDISPKNILSINSLSYIMLLVIVMYFLRPWFHEFFIVFYTHPAILVFVIATVLAGVMFNMKKTSVAAAMIVLAIFSFGTLIFNDLIMQKYIVTEQTYNNIDALPESSELRILPKAVAWRYLEDSLQKSRETLGPLDIVNNDGALIWTAPRIPDGAILFFTEPVKGLMIADATKSDRETKLISKELKVGEGIGITDSVFWKLYKKTFFMVIDEVYYITKDDKVLTVAPIIKYYFKFPVMIPYFAGVFVIDDQGEINSYSPEEVTNLDFFKDNWAFPESLARLYVDSYKYNLGIWNAWVLHKDQIEISDVYGQSNKQPFLMPTDEGLKWVVATEPYGKSYGVFKIFVVDALTGRISMLELDEDETLTGPVRVVSYVKKKFPRIDWATARVVEPRPYVIRGSLYWMLSITPNDYAGVSYTVLVNSEDNEVLPFESDKEVYEFMKTGKAIMAEGDKAEPADVSVINRIESIQKQLDELKALLE